MCLVFLGIMMERILILWIFIESNLDWCLIKEVEMILNGLVKIFVLELIFFLIKRK